MLEHVLADAVKKRVSDIHFILHDSIAFRIGKELQLYDGELLVEEDILKICCASNFSSPFVDQKEAAKNEKGKSALSMSNLKSDFFSQDGSFSFKDMRVRVHLFKAGQRLSGVLRLLYSHSLSLDCDPHSRLLQKLCSLQEGLVLMVGATGSGKSYTLACCLDYINQHFAKHIITLEDPVEHIFQPVRAFIQQRQLGRDVQSMAAGLRDALREDPDVIMIGELRDRETLETALEAAETGHLVFATLHAQRALLAVSRIVSMFPATRQEEVRHQLSLVLKAVICQRLAFLEEKIIPVRDILLNTPAVANLLRQKKEIQIASIQETSNTMQTFAKAVEVLSEKYGNHEVFSEVVRDMHELF